MESLIERQGNIQIATGGSAQSWTASWTHPGSSYTLESIALRFTLDSQTSNGYSVRVTEVLGPGNYSDRANKAEWKAAGTTVTVPLNSLAWDGKTSGTLTAVFMRRTNYYVCYTSIAFVLTYRSIADPSQVVVITTDAGAPQTVNITNTDPDVYHKVTWGYGANGYGLFGGILSNWDALGMVGNVDVWNRPRVSAAAMQAAGYTDFDPDSYATLYSMTYTTQGNTFTVLMTPIATDGTVYSQTSMDTYFDTITNGNNTVAAIVQADAASRNLVMHALAGEHIDDMEVIAVEAHEQSASWEDAVDTYGSKTRTNVEANAIASGPYDYGAATRSPAWAIASADMPTLYGFFPASGTADGSVVVQTYTVDGALVGTTIADAEVYLPETSTTRPTVQFVSENDTMDAVAAAIEASTGNAYVQNHTTVKRTITAQGYQGAGIAQVQVVTPDGVATGANSTQIEQLIRTAGTYSIEYHIIDTRGQTLVVTGGTKTVQAYTDPTITSIQGLRCDQNGDAKEDGTYIWVEASAIVNTGSTATYTAKLFVKNGSQIGSAVTLANGAGILGGSLDENTSYTVKVTVTDSYGVEDEEEVEIGTGTITFSRMAGGKGAAFGKLAEKYGVEIAETWPLYVHGAEILRLIIDMAHPIGSCIESLDNGWDPNTAWPWTAWSKDAGKWWRGV